MTHFLVLVLLFLGIGMYFMTPAERTRALRALLAALRAFRDAIALEGVQSSPFFDALRERTQRVIATPALIALSTLAFAGSPLVGLLLNAMCLWQMGLILERLVGRPAFVTIYVASGLAAAIAALSVSSDMSAAAPGPVFGMYSLLFVTYVSSVVHQSHLTIPLDVSKRLAPVGVLFVLYRLTTTGVGNAADAAAIVCGAAGGIVLARDLHVGLPQVRRLATALTTVLTVVTIYALVAVERPAGHVTDVRAEVERVVALEIRTASLYEKEIERFRKGRINAAALAAVIDNAIVPDLQAAAGRLRGLQDVPPEHQPIVATAQAFLEARHESWRLRAAALHKSDMQGLRKADTQEQASREAFHRLTLAPSSDRFSQPSS